MKKQFFVVFIIITASASLLFSCSKDHASRELYGRWKTSYGDTILFSMIDNKNILNYDVSLNPSLPMIANYEYTYSGNKLGIKNGMSGPNNFYFLQSFRWIEQNKSFEIQGVQWFPFMSSTSTYFTFTRTL